MTHYQDHPHFIGPRLPPDHPAYQRYLFQQAAEQLPAQRELVSLSRVQTLAVTLPPPRR